MAEMAVSFAIDTLLPLLTEEAKLLRGIHKDFAEIRDELVYIQAFLKDADTRAADKGESSSERVKTWVKQVTEAAFRIEDIIDDYMIYVAQQSRHPGCVASLSKIAHVIKTLKQRHQIVSEIQDIKSSVREIKERSGRYDFQINSRFEQGSSSSTGQQNVKWHDPRISSLYMEEAEVVGFEAPKNVLIDWLKGREERTVVSVVGMGGQGKTTLAKKVFDSKEVVGHFECRAWITVSQQYSVEGLLRDMLSQFYKQRGENPPQDFVRMDKGSLIDEVRNYLKQKRYVVVFDDVWTKDFWDEIKVVVIDNNNGSKIIMTTRNIDIAMHCKTFSFVEVYELEPLTHEQSWQLFNKKMFGFDYGGCCPKDLIDISHEIVEKCKGLPLAIVVIVGVLCTKEKNRLAWEMFSKYLSSELENDSHFKGVITGIIGLSYNDLPYYLKPCFLYFGMYPEDYEVKSYRVTQQWIAEGFVKEERGKTFEEVAEGYLAELIRRNLVQASKVKFDGKAQACRVHDLIHVIIREKFEDLSFCKHISEGGQSLFSGITRRLSIGTTSNDLTLTESPHVRSLLVFTNGSLISHDFVNKIAKKYKRLKVLDIEDVDWFTAPKNLVSLIHLKYLRFNRPFGACKLPNSIWLLQNLESLEMQNPFVVVASMPKEISKLRKLRHLLGDRISLIELKDGIGGLTSLQSLSSIVLNEDDDGVVELIRELGKLVKLRKLKLFYRGIKHVSDLSSSISKMQHLEKLSIRVDLIPFYSIEVIDLSLLSFSPMLQKISLWGRLERLPKGIPILQNLIKLELERSHLTDDPMKFLKNMPNLLILHLHDYAYDGESLHFQDGGFQKLKELSIRWLSNLNSIVIEKGALHSLKKLELVGNPRLQMVPTGIQYLEKLQVLNIKDMRIEFVESIAPDGGKEHWVIEHVPHVVIGHAGN